MVVGAVSKERGHLVFLQQVALTVYKVEVLHTLGATVGTGNGHATMIATTIKAFRGEHESSTAHLLLPSYYSMFSLLTPSN